MADTEGQNEPASNGNLRRTLGHALKLKFGLPPSEPTDQHLDSILNFISDLDRQPTDIDWKNACFRFVPDAGEYGYKAADNADLNDLWRRIRESNG